MCSFSPGYVEHKGVPVSFHGSRDHSIKQRLLQQLHITCSEKAEGNISITVCFYTAVVPEFWTLGFVFCELTFLLDFENDPTEFLSAVSFVTLLVLLVLCYLPCGGNKVFPV